MKVTEIKVNSCEPTSTSTPLTGSSVAMFSSEFPENEGIAIEKESAENKSDDSKTYTKLTKDSEGRDIVEVYNSQNNSLISREYSEWGYKIKEVFKPGTTIVSSKEKRDSDGVLLELTEFYDTHPYMPKIVFSYNFDKSVSSEQYYRNDENNTTEKTIHYDSRGKTVYSYDKKFVPTSFIEYRKDNSIKHYIERDILTNHYNLTTYREDGSVYETKETQKIFSGRVYSQNLYDREGKIINKKYWDYSANCSISENYRADKLFTREKFNSSDEILERTVYNRDGSKYFIVNYDKSGKITDYQKFKNTDNPKHDKFREKRLNGVIDSKITQGYTGICYFASFVKGMSLTENGRIALDKMYDYDYDTETSKIEFKNVNKSYSFTKEQIVDAMGRLGTEDPDFTAFALAWESYVSEIDSKVVDGGNASYVASTLLGIEPETNTFFNSVIKMSNEDLDRFAEKLKTKNVVLTVGTPPESVDYEVTKDEMKKGLVNDHMCTVYKITKNKVKYFDPRLGKNVTLTREEFLDNFMVYELFDVNDTKKE